MKLKEKQQCFWCGKNANRSIELKFYNYTTELGDGQTFYFCRNCYYEAIKKYNELNDYFIDCSRDKNVGEN